MYELSQKFVHSFVIKLHRKNRLRNHTHLVLSLRGLEEDVILLNRNIEILDRNIF